MQKHELTVGELRLLIKNLPDEFIVTQMEWDTTNERMDEVAVTDCFVCEPDKTLTLHVF